MITTDEQALRVMVNHRRKGRKGHPHAVRRYLKRGLDLSDLMGWEIYIDRKIAMAERAKVLLPFVIMTESPTFNVPLGALPGGDSERYRKDITATIEGSRITLDFRVFLSANTRITEANDHD